MGGPKCELKLGEITIFGFIPHPFVEHVLRIFTCSCLKTILTIKLLILSFFKKKWSLQIIFNNKIYRCGVLDYYFQ